MRRLAVFLAVLFQVGVLSYMAAEREWILAFGRTVFLRTAPVDPMDPFRGEFVRLRYEFSDLSLRDFKVGTKADLDRKGTPIYAVFQAEQDGVAAFQYASFDRPGEEIFLRGRTTHSWWGSRSDFTVGYGIEAYFVQQGKGRELESQLGNRTGIQVPLEMETSISGSGTAVLRGHRWSRLGIGLEILERGARKSDNEPFRPPNNPDNVRKDGKRSCRVRLTLKNTSDAPLALVLLPDNASFVLKPASHDSRDYSPAGPLSPDPAPTDEHALLLEPGMEKSVDLDMSDARWHVREADKAAVEIGTLDNWNQTFRLVYRPPTAQQCKNLRLGSKVWHGSLPGRAFQGDGGRVD